MAAMDTTEASSWAAVLKATGATPLDDLSIGLDAPMAMACSPWAPSEMAASPWSPATPCVVSAGGYAALSSPTPMSPAFGSAAGYPTTQAFQGFAQHPSQAVFAQGAPRQWNACSPPSRTWHAPPSPFAASPLVQSPGAKIRQNAARFGIPLQLRASAGEVSAPVPVRAVSGSVMVPSPTAVFATTSAVTQSAAGGAFAWTGPAPSCSVEAPATIHPSALIRSMVTPMSAAHYRRVRGGSGGGA